MIKLTNGINNVEPTSIAEVLRDMSSLVLILEIVLHHLQNKYISQLAERLRE
jgi:hypothetical protein